MVANTSPVIRAAVFNMTTNQNGEKLFAVLKYKYSVVNGEPKWDAAHYTMNEKTLINAITGTQIDFINVAVKDGRIVGKGAQLDRFKKIGNAQIVIGVMTMNASNRTKVIGYRVVFSTGMMKAVKIQDVVKYAEQAQRTGTIPFQNAMFIPAKSDGTTAFLRAYNDGDFIPEQHIYTAKAKQVVDNREAVEEFGGKKQAESKKLSDIYTKEQLAVLKKGKAQSLPIRIYANPKLQAEQMEALRSALEKRINPQRYAHPDYQAQKMRFLTVQLMKHNRINEYLNPKYQFEQLVRLQSAVELGLDVKRIQKPSMTVTEMDDEILHMQLETYNTVQPRAGKRFTERV